MKKTGFVVMFILAFAAKAHSAAVLMKDGGRLEGEIISSTPQGVVLRTNGEDVHLDAEKIQGIDYSPSQPAPSPAPAPYPRVVRVRPERAFDPLQDTLSFDFGLAAPLSGVDFSAIGGGRAGNGDVGPALGLQYLHALSPRAALGMEFHWYERSTTDSGDLLPPADAHIYGDTVLFMGVLKYKLSDRGRARPYVLLGAGADRTSTTIDARPDPGLVWADTGTDERRTLIDDSRWGAAFSARLGLDFLFREPWTFGLEAGWTGLSSAAYGATGQGRLLGLSGVWGGLNFFTFAARWGWAL